MIPKAEGCKGCRHGADDSREAIERFVKRLEQSSGVPLVSPETYRRRLDACRSCDSLRHGHTCSRCGCYVEVRAKLAESDCPDPLASRWG